MREKGTRPKFSRQLRIILAVRDDRLWPEADGRGIGDERPLLRKADDQYGDFRKYVGERLVSARKQTFG